MRYHFLILGLLSSVSGNSQNYTYRVYEKVDLTAIENQALYQRNNELSHFLLKAVEIGEITPYRMVDYEIIGKVSIDEFHENLRFGELESEWNWDAEEYYFWDETVNYEGKTYVSLAEENVDNKPDEIDNEYWAIYVAPKFLLREASSIVLDYTVQKSERSYQFIHFFIPGDYTDFGVDKYVVSLRYEDCIKAMNRMNTPWYRPAYPPWGWVVGDIFNVDYYNFTSESGKGRMIYDLISSGQAGDVIMQTQSSDDDISVFISSSLDGSSDQGFDFTFDKKNRIDSIRIMGSQYSNSGDTFFEFKSKNIKSNLLKKAYQVEFGGFMTISQAFENNLLFSEDIDTISINGNFLGTGKDPLSDKFEPSNVKATNFSTNQFRITQSSSYNLNQADNAFLKRPGYHFGQIVLDAIVNNEISDIYTNDSLAQMMTKTEFQERLEIYSYEEYLYDPWEETYEYYEGDMVTYENLSYYAIVDGAKGKVPSNESEHWERSDQFVEVYDGNSFTKLNVVTSIVFDDSGKILSREPVALGIYVGAEYTPEGIDLPVCYIKFDDFEIISKRDGRAQLNEVPYSDLIRQGKLRGSIYSTSAIEIYH